MKIGKVKKGKYEYFRVQVTDSLGNRKELLGKTRKEVKEKYEQFIKSDIGNLNLCNMTVEEFFHYYLFDVVLPSGSIKDKSFTDYERLFRLHIKNSSISKIKITDLKKEHLQKYFNSKQQENYKLNTIKAIKGYIGTVLTYAENEDIINKNFCKGIKLKKDIKQEENKLLTDEEIDRLLNSLEEDKQLLIIIKIALGTGMRINEILALNESDFNFDNNSININKTVSRCREYKGNNFKMVTKITPPKTKNSIRICYFPNTLSKDLKEFIKSVKIEYFKKCIKYTNKSILFIDKKFNYIYYNRLAIKLNKLYKTNDINCSGFHILRHTHISKLYRQGISQKIIQQQVGHSNLNMTMHYTHIENKEQEQALQVLNNYFGN